MRVRLPVRRVVAFGALFAIALLASLPLRLVLGALDTGLTAREARGSVWLGRLQEARIGGATLGDLDARLAPAPLLVGQARVEVERETSGPDRLRAALGLSGAVRSLNDVSGTISVETLFAPLPIGTLDLADVSVRFRDGVCDRAEGQVRAAVTAAIAGVDLAQGLSGRVRCDRGALLIPLASAAGTEGLALRVRGDGRWEAELSGGGAAQSLSGQF